MILKLNEKTQKLIEEQINQQKILLQKLEQAKTNDEKNSLLSVCVEISKYILKRFFKFFVFVFFKMIKKISELIEEEKSSIVKQSSEFLSNTSSLTSNIMDIRKRKLVNTAIVSLICFIFKVIAVINENFTYFKPNKVPKILPTKQQTKLVNYPVEKTNQTSTPAFLLPSSTTPSIVSVAHVSTPKAAPNYRQMATTNVDHRPKGLIINEIENEEDMNAIVKNMKVCLNFSF